MATKFSPCKGSYVLNQFPSNVRFGMNGFHVSASGAIQGHHGPLVFLTHSLIHHFETLQNSKKLQTTTEMWLLKDFLDSDCIKNIVEKGEIANFEHFNLQVHNAFINLLK